MDSELFLPPELMIRELAEETVTTLFQLLRERGFHIGSASVFERIMPTMPDSFDSTHMQSGQRLRIRIVDVLPEYVEDFDRATGVWIRIQSRGGNWQEFWAPKENPVQWVQDRFAAELDSTDRRILIVRLWHRAFPPNSDGICDVDLTPLLQA